MLILISKYHRINNAYHSPLLLLFMLIFIIVFIEFDDFFVCFSGTTTCHRLDVHQISYLDYFLCVKAF